MAAESFESVWPAELSYPGMPKASAQFPDMPGWQPTDCIEKQSVSAIDMSRR
jgi:hypothetical protein